MEKTLWMHIQQVRAQSPLVHNITNFVVMNNTANALLAVGASPIMAHAKTEVVEMVTISDSLVINIGTLDEVWSESMLLAANTASQLGKPWILDPVGAGATSYRDHILKELLREKPTVIRGNASEIIALNKSNLIKTKGVDSTSQSGEAVKAALDLHRQYGSVVCISGETDIVISGSQEIHLKNGHLLMTKVTGLGCSASAIVGAFIAVIANKTEAVTAAMALMGVAGELAEKESDGPGSLQVKLLDKLYNITETEFGNTLKFSI
ncbi:MULTISPECIES: hydroxyethylthiazole kinase [unclassified Sphingobacterium]|uniref:hydroxyethylthiazole kinase n=1 Tax=unclassified Sphingobacterium TaxID=2609468 RepID=UPI0010D80966|nr:MULTISPECIES: hydroxyethylthiazole kinase [unclassified Sphingobacterium]MCS3554535.1 hydroxyethylthiazole kinase [Sphingobacterium sp. JUb21]TCR07525.1 hydroxyethylthiazole kinase [Sphingobacterium sp. JUb20]